MPLQDWIYKLEVGEGARYVKLGTFLLLLVALAVTYDLRRFKNFSTSEAMDTAQLARNLAQGRGYTTQFIRPLSMHLIQEHSPDKKSRIESAHPDLANPPVYPILLAGLMKVMPFHYHLTDTQKTHFWRYQPEVFIAAFNQLLFFSAGFLLFRLARQLFDPTVAWVSLILFFVTELYWRFSVSGLPTLWLINLFFAITWCLLTLDRIQHPDADQKVDADEGLTPNPTSPSASSPLSVAPSSSGSASALALPRSDQFGIGPSGPRLPRSALLLAALTGLLIGLGALSRYSFAWILLPVLAFFAFYFPGRRAALSLTTAGALLMVLTPWLARNYHLSGTFFGTAGYAVYDQTEPFPGDVLERSLHPDLDKVGVEQVARKLVVNFADLIRNDLPKLGGSWISAFFLAGLLLQFRSPALTRVRAFLILVLAVFAIAQSLAKTHLSLEAPEVTSENQLSLAAPLVFVFGVAMYFTLLEQLKMPFNELRYLVTGVLISVAGLPLILSLLPPRTAPVAYPPYFPPFLQEIGSWMEPDELTMSDMPWAIAWYGDRKSIWLTLNSEKDFYEINDFQKPIKAVVLTPITTDAPLLSQLLKNNTHWGKFVLQTLFKGEIPSGFPLKNSFASYLRDGFIVFIDRERWRK